MPVPAVAGSAVVYDKQLGKTASVERHTTLSADGFQLDLPPGRYRLEAYHGKQYLPTSTEITVAEERVTTTLKLMRFADMPTAGWYSGDTHVHRSMLELPNVILAEDLNVALPLNYWVRDSREIPMDSGPVLPPEVQHVDATHLIYPINTEYEIFSIDGKSQTQGAVFVLNHREPLRLKAPPVSEIAQVARQQGAMLELDKHSWPWSMMIVPIMNVDLFELSNNHHWKTQFGFPNFVLESAPDWPEIERNERGFTERGWTDFGFQTYYALLNCGFRLRVTAGTASGVHPVPLGHGRVFVHTGLDFSFENWMKGLNAGHSFVTQGPLLDVRFDGELPGTTWEKADRENRVIITGVINSAQPLTSVEVIVNGRVQSSILPEQAQTEVGSYRATVDLSVDLDGSSWIALRCYERAPADKVVFAHTNPVFVDVAQAPLAPDRRALTYFIQRMDAEISRNAGVISAAALGEYQAARKIYQALLDGRQVP
ncbi:MAG: CehA/McbA family metallohydrolase [Pirellulaceae bacterium]